MKMKNIFLRSILLVISMLASIAASAQNYRLYINDFEVEADETRTVSVLLENGTMGFTGFETKIFLPEGLTLVETYDEDECANVAFFLNVDRKKSKHDISYAKQADGSYKILAGGNGVQTYGGTSGTELFNFTVKVAANFTGTATIRIAETTFSDVNLKGYDLAEETCTVKAKTVAPDPEPEPEPDVTGYHLLIKDFNIAPGATMTVPVLLYNGTTGFTGFETKIFLPEGLSLVEVYDEDEGMNMAFYLNADRKKSKHDIAYAKQADGSYKILAGGNGVQTYGGVSGTELFYFSVTADAKFAGTAEIRLAETTFSDVNLKGYDFPEETCTVTGPDPIVTPDEPEYRLHIDDFSIEAGATKTVSVLLDNGTTGFTGFEAKIFLPEGLSLVEVYDEDEGMNMAFYLNADRKKSKHDIAYAKQADGSYKILAGGNGVQTYGGVSGTELFYFSVTADANFAGTAEIRLAETTFSDVNLKGYDFPDETCTVTINRVVVEYTITATSANTSQGIVTGGGTYTHGTSVTLTATPADGYEFVQWSDGTTANPYTFTATANKSVTAQFRAKSYTITATSANTSLGTVTGGGTYTHGATVTLTATPADGYEFVQWSDGTTANPYTFTATANKSVTAQFRAKSYTITATSANTSQGTVTGGGTYTHGASVTLTATPADGYEFVQWSDGTTANPYTFTATANKSVTAQFRAKSYTITVSSADSNQGTVTGGGTYTHGTSVTLTATPADGYEFVQWSDGTTANPYTFTATADKSVTAQFQATAALGDVNNDSKITAIDVVGAVNLILNTNTNGLVRAAADVNRDGSVTVADVTGIINLALGLPLTANSNQRRVLAADSDARLAIDAFRLPPGADELVPVVLCAEADEFTALQFDVLLPGGIRLTDVLCDDDHLAAFAQQADGKMRIVVLSPDNVPFAANGLAALTLQLAADADAAPGIIAVDAIEVARHDMSRAAPAAFSATFGFAGPTGIDSVESTDNTPLYDIQGRRTAGAGHGIYVTQGRKVVK